MTHFWSQPQVDIREAAAMLEYQPFPGKEAKHIFALYFYILVLCATHLKKYGHTFSLLLLTFCNQSDITLVIICDVLKTFRSCNKLKIFQ